MIGGGKTANLLKSSPKSLRTIWIMDRPKAAALIAYSENGKCRKTFLSVGRSVLEESVFLSVSELKQIVTEPVSPKRSAQPPSSPSLTKSTQSTPVDLTQRPLYTYLFPTNVCRNNMFDLDWIVVLVFGRNVLDCHTRKMCTYLSRTFMTRLVQRLLVNERVFSNICVYR